MGRCPKPTRNRLSGHGPGRQSVHGALEGHDQFVGAGSEQDANWDGDRQFEQHSDDWLRVSRSRGIAHGRFAKNTMRGPAYFALERSVQGTRQAAGRHAEREMTEDPHRVLVGPLKLRFRPQVEQDALQNSRKDYHHYGARHQREPDWAADRKTGQTAGREDGPETEKGAARKRGPGLGVR
jgi:hypothetical protein